MRFGRLDLNLLVALDALLAERSVSMAADRICLSQSATSSALGRLREYFDDELLVAKGRQMVLTPRAESLIEPVRAVLDQVRETIAVPPPFDPQTCDRSIAIMASDYVTEVLLADLLIELETAAPYMRFEIRALNDELVETLERGWADLLITIDRAISPDHPSLPLYEDDYVVVGWEGNAALHRPLTAEEYLGFGHVTVRFGRARIRAHEDWFLEQQSIARRVEVVAPSFLAVPPMLVGSNRVATMHRRLAERVVGNLPLVVRDLPIAIPPIRQTVQWHSASSSDPALRWIIERLRLAAGGSRRVVPEDEAVPAFA